MRLPLMLSVPHNAWHCEQEHKARQEAEAARQLQKSRAAAAARASAGSSGGGKYGGRGPPPQQPRISKESKGW